MQTRIIYLILFLLPTAVAQAKVGTPSLVFGACQNGPAGQLCQCHLEYGQGCDGDPGLSALPCMSAGIIMPQAGTCAVKKGEEAKASEDPNAAAAGEGSGQKIKSADGAWVCFAPARKAPADIASLGDCQKETGKPYCSCFQKFSEGCGVEKGTGPIASVASIQSCKIGEGIDLEATCPSGTGTGKAAWKCTSLDPSERVGNCSCTLDIRALDICSKCNNGKPETNPASQCGLLGPEENLALESGLECGLQDTTQRTSLRCPDGTASAGALKVFIAQWHCFTR